VFFQAGGMIVALWDRGKLAEDSVVDDNGGWGGVTLAYNSASPEDVDVTLSEAAAAGGSIGRAGARTFWGGYSGVFIDPDGHPGRWLTIRGGSSVRMGLSDCTD